MFKKYSNTNIGTSLISKESISAFIESEEEVGGNKAYYHKSIVVESYRNGLILAVFVNEEDFLEFKELLENEPIGIEKFYICREFMVVKTPADLDKIKPCSAFTEGAEFKMQDLSNEKILLIPDYINNK